MRFPKSKYCGRLVSGNGYSTLVSTCPPVCVIWGLGNVNGFEIKPRGNLSTSEDRSHTSISSEIICKYWIYETIFPSKHPSKPGRRTTRPSKLPLHPQPSYSSAFNSPTRKELRFLTSSSMCADIAGKLFRCPPITGGAKRHLHSQMIAALKRSAAQGRPVPVPSCEQYAYLHT